jgi:hypothetical protein
LVFPATAKIKSRRLIKLNDWLLERYRAGETVVLLSTKSNNWIVLMRELNRNAGACLRLVQPIQGPIYQRGLSRTDLTGKRDETLAILDAIHQSHSAPSSISFVRQE